MKTLEIFWDVGSPYTYLAIKHLEQRWEEVGERVMLRPFLIGGVFKGTGNSMPAAVPANDAVVLLLCRGDDDGAPVELIDVQHVSPRLVVFTTSAATMVLKGCRRPFFSGQGFGWMSVGGNQHFHLVYKAFHLTVLRTISSSCNPISSIVHVRSSAFLR